ncbi:TetR/AcrR family transcriptional regulator [Bradyrhizobium sp.]|uniref:TetR/AcrR family transcriptional regulator n=1 Tax=Bradyrhizobium sp. TaxID=376 RepID=UPI00238BE112|nr:TetR/AcrR family transcriptional regulator [Bradyrhizobium sp.]MDE1935505.1 TetR/AcrR family transcriptional regulator [Bradyrhizobium sp.]MDE2063754.1 TetR/AcrR family transcriptional regulator [Bradyrhizobium sp.]
MPAVPKHRQPIVNTALTLFRRQGYSRTGLNEIVDVSGAPKGSLYHYFPLGKSSIAVAAVTEAGRRIAATLTKLAGECRSTGELVRRHAELLAGWMRASGFRDGCPITTVLLELAPGDRDVTEAGRAAYRARVSILSDKLIADGFPKARAEALAVLCTSALQGALIQARVERSGRALETTASELARLLDAALTR